ncbi:MAG: TRAP transporter large permease subunit [Burkholderiaceae bacterium]
MIDALPFVMLGTLALLLFSGLPVAIILCGLGVGFCIVGIALGEMPWVAMYGIPPKLAYAVSGPFYPAVAMLLFMGVALEKSGIAADMLSCLRVLLRWMPGGMAIAVLLIGVILAPAAGIVGASVVTLSLIALPAMLQNGYRPEVATGAVAAAGTVGIILPPAVMLFFLAGKFQVPMGSMFMATIVPGGILIVLYLLYYLVTSWLRPPSAPLNEAANLLPGNRWSWALLILRGLVAPLALICLVLGSIIAGWVTPSQSGAIGAAGGLLLVFINGRMSWPLFRDMIAGTANLTAMVFFIIMAAAVFSYPFRYFGGDTAISDALTALDIGPWPMLLLIVSIIFVLGFFIDWIEITVITLPLFVPVLQGLALYGLEPGSPATMLWIAGLVALVLQTSFLTPPFGFALFFLKGSAPPGVTLADIYRGIAPILVIQLVVIGLVLAMPALITWLPALVYAR